MFFKMSIYARSGRLGHVRGGGCLTASLRQNPDVCIRRRQCDDGIPEYDHPLMDRRFRAGPAGRHGSLVTSGCCRRVGEREIERGGRDRAWPDPRGPARDTARVVGGGVPTGTAGRAVWSSHAGGHCRVAEGSGGGADGPSGCGWGEGVARGCIGAGGAGAGGERLKGLCAAAASGIGPGTDIRRRLGGIHTRRLRSSAQGVPGLCRAGLRGRSVQSRGHVRKKPGRAPR